MHNDFITSNARHSARCAAESILDRRVIADPAVCIHIAANLWIAKLCKQYVQICTCGRVCMGKRVRGSRPIYRAERDCAPVCDVWNRSVNGMESNARNKINITSAQKTKHSNSIERFGVFAVCVSECADHKVEI